MKLVDGKKYFRISEVCEQVERSATTIARVWYEAERYAIENNIHFPFVLPPYRQDLDKKGTKYWDEEAIKKLIKFRDSIMPGDLSFYTSQNMWGERGKMYTERRNFRRQMAEEQGVDISKELTKLTEEQNDED